MDPIMRLIRIDLTEVRLPLIAPFETSFGKTTDRRILLAQVFDEQGRSGWGECTASETPFYNHESIDTAWIILKSYLIPSILGAELSAPDEVWPLFKQVRGHRMAKATLETACWDLYARQLEKPLWEVLGGRRQEIASGVSIGLQPSLDRLMEKIELELQAGYQRIKLKIKPGQDVAMVREVRRQFPTVQLTVDANSAYSLDDYLVFEQLDEMGLAYIEQPLDHDDLVDHAKLQARLKTPLCLDESIVSLNRARQSIEIGSCRIINIKLGRVGGHSQAKAIHDYCYLHNVPVWCGGMLESGIGRAHNIAMSTLEGFVLPGDVSASKRYWDHDIISPAVEATPRGTITVPNGPGIGFGVDEEMIHQFAVRKETYGAQG
jgi:O-succinylbenzoate synthase